MSRIQSKFRQLQKKGEKALVTFITAGDPNLAVTEKLVHSLESAGADLIELGVPFSDPMADGPVIQRSSERALRSKTTLKSILNLVKKIRKRSEIPIILMGYYNPILQYGPSKFCREAKAAGVDGLIVVDLPPEESEELHQFSKKFKIHLIYLLTPTADKNRIQKIKKLASGFVYYVSMTGITGGKINSLNLIAHPIKKIKQIISLPLCIGFGIRTPEDARKLSRFSEGVVVGSALVSLIEKKRAQASFFVTRFIKGIKKAI